MPRTGTTEKRQLSAFEVYKELNTSFLESDEVDVEKEVEEEKVLKRQRAKAKKVKKETKPATEPVAMDGDVVDVGESKTQVDNNSEDYKLRERKKRKGKEVTNEKLEEAPSKKRGRGKPLKEIALANDDVVPTVVTAEPSSTKIDEKQIVVQEEEIVVDEVFSSETSPTKANKAGKTGPKKKVKNKGESITVPELFLVPATSTPFQKSTEKFGSIKPENFCTLEAAKKAQDVKNFDRFIENLNFNDSYAANADAFGWMINPINPATFMQQIWETKPFWIDRHLYPNYYESLFSTKELNNILINNNIEYGVNIDVTQYVEGERKTLNPEGRVYSNVMWDNYNEGCSIRLLNPQTYSESVWRLTSTLQEYFGTFVGANVYLTPPGTQGFAPHADDIEAFVLQLEGKKRWSVYKPKELLPRFSSRNFGPDEVGELVLAVELNPGDLLYMPRGFVHQAFCSPGHHSLHMTVSSTQLNSYADLFEKMLPQVLKIAVERDVEFRRSLPVDYMRFTGVVHDEGQKNITDKTVARDRTQFNTHVKTLFKRLSSFLPIDGACDQMAKKFIVDSQPPALTEDEKSRCILKDQMKFSPKKGVPIKLFEEINKNTQIRLIRRYCLRLVVEGDSQPIVYYNAENSRVYHGKEEPATLAVTEEEALCVEHLIKMYPSYCLVSTLPLESDDDKITFCNALYEKCLLTTKEILKPVAEEKSF